MVPRAEGGGIDIFSPLAAAGGWRLGWDRSSCPLSSPSVSFPSSAGGVALLRALSALTGLQVQASMGLATGSFQNGESASVARLLSNQALRLLTSGCFFFSVLSPELLVRRQRVFFRLRPASSRAGAAVRQRGRPAGLVLAG